MTLRAITVVGDVAYVPLTQGKISCVDASLVPEIEAYNWCAVKNNNTFYAVTNVFSEGEKRQRRLHLHRLAIKAPPGIAVDHRDGDGLNNRASNLRLADASENACNRRTPNKNTSGFKGAHYDRRAKKWQARIMKNGARVYLGLFQTPEEASAAYRLAALDMHGEFAKTD